MSKDKKKPFIVKTKHGDVLVTGTRFNVDAYAKNETFETSLFEGGVALYQNNKKIATLNPHQKSSFEKGKLIISTIDGEDESLWRRGLITFKDKNLEEILPSLAKNFNVEIKVLSKNLSKETFTGKFRQSGGLEYALKVLQKSVPFTYEKDEENGSIYIK